MRRRLLLLVASALAPLLLTVAAPPHPAAAASCFMHSCDGQDPNAAGCGNDATTLDSVGDGFNTAVVELRYSAACNAAWARITVFPGDAPTSITWMWVLESQLQVANPGTVRQVRFLTLSSGGSPWTLMADSANLTRACIQFVTGSGPYRCTAWWLPRINVGNGLMIPQGTASARDISCPYGERYWAWGVSTGGSWGATWYLSGLPHNATVSLTADVRCDGTATNVLYDVDDPSGGRHWFRVNQNIYDFAPLGVWQTDANGNLVVRISDGQNPNGQVVASTISVQVVV